MNHADRAVIWKAPRNSADWENSLHDAFVSLPAGKMLVYRVARPVASNGAPPVNKMAADVARRLKGALVQWPAKACEGQNIVREWCYAIQKRNAA
jgi:hypothetical protein